MIRLSGVARLSIFAIIFIFVLHFLSSSSNQDTYADESDGWGERLGLDHYADWEAGVAGRLGDGIERVKGSLGVIQGGLGWGKQGRRLGNLYELVTTSNPVPRVAYFDERSSFDRLRLSSTRVLGHGPAGIGSSDNADDEDITLPARRHILVTGGFGSLGKHVVRDLLLGLSRNAKYSDDEFQLNGGDEMEEEDILITILDVNDRTAELNYLLQSAAPAASKVKGTDPRAQAFTSSERSVSSFKRSGKLRIVAGDVRDKQLMESLLAPAPSTDHRDSEGSKARPNALKGHVPTTVVIPPVSGVIHLAAYDPNRCRLNPADCFSVETDGMTNILNALKREGLETPADGPTASVVADRPWVVVPRRGEAWVQSRNATNPDASTVSLPEAEELLKSFAVEHPLHAMLMKLPSSNSIIGDPFTSRFDPIPHIIQSALGDLPVQVYTLSDNVHDDFLGIDDAAQSIVQSARMLELASHKDYLRLLGFVSEVSVVGPELSRRGKIGPVAEVAKIAISLAMSSSPFAEIVEGGADAADERVKLGRVSARTAHRKVLSKVLGFAPSITVQTSMKTYIEGVLATQAEHLSKKINVACSSPPSIPVLEEGVLGLSGCNVQLLTVIEGAYYTLGCSAGLEEARTSPLMLLGAIPFKEGVRGVEVVAERGMEGKVDFQLRCPALGPDGKANGDSEIIVWADTTNGGEFSEAGAAGERTIAEWFTVDFVKRDARAFTLTLPPTEGVRDGDEPKRRLGLRDPTSSSMETVFQEQSTEMRPLMWRINPICCSNLEKKKDLWDFFKEDPVITSQVTFPSEDGRTSLAESTLSMQRCKDLRREHDRIVKLRKFLKSPAADTICDAQRGEASGWEDKDLVTCQIDCTAPLVCISSDECKCTRDRCGDPRAKGPFPDVAYTSQISFNLKPSELVRPTVAQRVEAIPWDEIILPGARRAFSTPLEDLPRVNVIDLPPTIDTHLKAAACYDLDKSPLPFLGDHLTVEALRNRSVPMDEADFVMVPYFQGCYYNYLQENTFKKLADTVGFAETRVATAEHISASKIVIPFTHDFGSCTGWWPRLEEVLGRAPPSPMDQAVSWQVNGDYNTRCVKPDRDVIMPAVSKHSKALSVAYSSIDSIAPATSRQYLAFFAGGVRGFGAVARTRIGCGRISQDVTKATVLYQQFASGQRYLGTLNSAKFCLLPRGIPAWTTRTFEAIYAGCIPAFIVDRNIFPFQDILDYSLFSVTIPESDAHRVEEILATYTDAQIFELQAHLLKVREAFLFKEGEEWERKGPVFFSLVSMAMRLYLEYPAVGSCPRSALP